ncbi:hypothetical protein BST61_g11378 [Cercospora zeina]
MAYALLLLSWISATSAQRRSFSDFPENWRATATNTPTIPTCEPATGIYSNAACPIATTFWNGDVYHYANPYMFLDNSVYGGDTAWSTCNIDDCALWCEQSGSQCLGWGYSKFECYCKKFMVPPLREAYWNDWGSDITAFLRITGYNFTGQPGGPPVPATSTLLGAGLSPSAGIETVVVATTTPEAFPAGPSPSSTIAGVFSSEAVVVPVPIPESSTFTTAASASAAVPVASLPQSTSSPNQALPPPPPSAPLSSSSSAAPVQLNPTTTLITTPTPIPPQSPSPPSPPSPAPTICPAANAALTTLNSRPFQITCNAAHCGATATYSGTGAAITNLASCIAQCTGGCSGLYFTSGLCMEIVGGGSRCPYDMRGYTAAYVVGAAPTAAAAAGGGGGLLGLGVGGIL